MKKSWKKALSNFMIERVVTYNVHFHSTPPHFKSMHKNEQMLKAPNLDQTITNMKQMSDLAEPS